MSVSFTKGDQSYFQYHKNRARKEGYAATENAQGRGDVLGYLSEKNTINGVWVGSHAAALGLSGPAIERDAATLFELAKNPTTGQQMGKKPADFLSLDERVAAEMTKLGLDGRYEGMSPAAYDTERVAVRYRLQREHQDRSAVTCIDFTMAATKSVSILYGMYLAAGDEANAQRVVDAFERACTRVDHLFETDFLKTRLGTPGTDVIAQVDVTGGAVGVGYLHETARPALGLPGMPHLHRHTLYSTRVQVFDPKTNEMKYLQMDTAAARDARQVLSGYMDLAVEQEIGAEFGLEFVTPDHELSKPVGERNREIRGLDSEDLLKAWSARAEAIEQKAKELIEAFTARTGRTPTPTEEIQLAQQATLVTRENKAADRDSEMASWAALAEETLGSDWRQVTQDLAAGGAAPATIAPASLTFATRRDLAAQAIAEIEAEGRTAWTLNHIHARVIKVIKGTYGAQLDPANVDELVESVTRLASEEVSVACTGYQAVEGHVTSGHTRRADGTSVFVRHGEQLFTSASVLRKEADMVAWAGDVDPARRISLAAFERAVDHWAREDGHRIAPDQEAAARHLCSSGRTVDTMVGPAGAGKTTTLKVQVRAAQYDGRKVIGLTLGQSAADNMMSGAKLDEVYNYAEFATRISHGLLKFEQGAFYVVDEASAVSLPDLHSLAENARLVGATVILTGDYQQHGTVTGAGGTLRLVHEEAPGAELESIWRFWQHDADGKRVLDADYAALTLRVRSGDVTAAKEMLDRGMVRFGTREEMRNAAIADWETNLRNGRHAVIPVRSNEERAELARRGVAAMLEGGHLGADTGWALSDGTDVYVGSFVMARQTNGELRFAPDSRGGRGQKVANRQTFRVIGHNPLTGELKVKSESNGKTIDLPRSYWSEHVESSIAVTGLGVQGLTTGADHTMLEATSTRADLYVGMTRGQYDHTVYIVTDEMDAEGHTSDKFRNPEQALASIIRRDTSEKGATAQIREDWDTAVSVRTLTGRHRYYADLARLTVRESVEASVRAAMPQADAAWVMGAEAWPTLADRLAELQCAGQDTTALLMETLAERGLADNAPGGHAADPAALLTWRLQGLETSIAPDGAATATTVVLPWLSVVELPIDANSDAVDAMRTYELAAVQRATYLADRALRDQVDWLEHLTGPAGTLEREQYLALVAAVAAYRENYQVDTTDAALLGPTAGMTRAQEAARAHVAALVESYTRGEALVPAEDLVLAATAERDLAFPGRAFATGRDADVPAGPAPAPAVEVPAWERTWGQVSDKVLGAEAAQAEKEQVALASNLTRMHTDLEAARTRSAAQAAKVAAGDGVAVRALHARLTQLQTQEADQVAVVEARARRAEARTAADAAAARIAELEIVTGKVLSRGRAEAASELLSLRQRHATLLTGLAELDQQVEKLQRQAGPDVVWGRVRADLDELRSRWDNQLEIADATDAAGVAHARADVRRIETALSQSRARLDEAASKESQIRAEQDLRAAQTPEVVATETSYRNQLAWVQAKERAAEARNARADEVTGPTHDRGDLGRQVDRDRQA